MINHIYQQLGYFVAGLITICASSCSSYVASSPENLHQHPTNSSRFRNLQLMRNQIQAQASQAVLPFNPVPPVLASSAASDSTVTVTVYKVDNSCQNLNPEAVTGPDKHLMSSAVNELLKQQVFSSLGLVGYRLRIDRNLGIATVDLRTSGNDRQKLQNLSSCQMLGLFGGLRQTLTSYAPWQIKTVRFTELGEDILITSRE